MKRYLITSNISDHVGYTNQLVRIKTVHKNNYFTVTDGKTSWYAGEEELTEVTRYKQYDFVYNLVKHITLSIFGIKPYILVAFDKTYPDTRIYLQVRYSAPCTKTGEVQEWNGRKWYLSDHMTEDEVVKTAWCAFEAAVKHEVMEGFKFDDVIVFNPHVNFRALLEVSHDEVRRAEK